MYPVFSLQTSDSKRTHGGFAQGARYDGFPTVYSNRSGLAGPFQIRESRRRGRVHVSKRYVALFVCFSTKVVHLEIVTSLTTEAFLAAFSRFTARRGHCAQLMSDNGTNFVGASRELQEEQEFLESKT
jgi:hypothetical protein